MSLPAGTRIRVTGGPWPERIRAVGVVVTQPNGPGVYPDDPRDRDGVLVLLDDDPLAIEEGQMRYRGWSCRIRRSDVEVLTDA